MDGWKWLQMNVTKGNGFSVNAILNITQPEQRVLMELWQKDPFDPELVKKLIYFVTTKGENIVSEYGGAYPIPRWIGE